jgi:hypothetical protein
MLVVGALNHAFENAISKILRPSRISMEELVHDGLQRVKLSRSGIRCGWRTLLGCSMDHVHARVSRRHPLSKRDKEVNPKIKIAFVGPHVTVLPEKSLRECPAIDFVCRGEFDLSVVDYAQGKALGEIPGVSYLRDSNIVHNDALPIQDLDALPHVTDVY